MVTCCYAHFTDTTAPCL